MLGGRGGSGWSGFDESLPFPASLEYNDEVLVGFVFFLVVM